MISSNYFSWTFLFIKDIFCLSVKHCSNKISKKHCTVPCEIKIRLPSSRTGTVLCLQTPWKSGMDFPFRHHTSQGQTYRKDALFPLHHMYMDWGADENGCVNVLCADEAESKCLHSFCCNMIPGFRDHSSSWIRNGKCESSFTAKV